MSTLSVTTVSTANGTTDLTLLSGNSSAGDIVISSNGYGIVLSGNSTSNTLYLVSNGNVGIGSSTPASELYVKRGTVAFEPANSGYYAASFYAAQNATTNYGLQVRTNWQAVENKIVSFGVVDAVSGTDTERFAINGIGAVTISSNTLTLGTSSIAANGYTYLPNGLKANFGNFAANSTVGNATFASAFTTLYTVHLSSGNSLSNSYFLSSATTAAVQGRTSSVANPGGLLYYWAIGV